MKPDDKPNILIVDDVEPNVILLETTLRHLNATIIKAFSAKEALDKIKGKELALALIDVNMPGMNGIELVSHILRDKGRSLVPIIFITAYPCEESELEKIYETGIIDYILKPIDPRLLISKVKIFLELNRQKCKVLSSEKLYRMLLNASPEGIIIMDTSLSIREISTMASALFELSGKDDFIGNNIITLFPPDEHSRLQEVIKETMELGQVLNAEFLITRSNQTRLNCEISLKLIRDNNEKPRALMAVIRDVSQRKMIQHKMISDHCLASIEKLSRGISYEINQPLKLLSLGLENLLVEISKSKTVDPEYFHNTAKQIFNNIARITNAIDHINILSSVNRNFTVIEFDIHNAIRNAVSVINNQFGNAGIAFTTHFDKNMPAIHGDPEKFEQVILNLLLNSQDAIEEKLRIVDTEFKRLVDIKTCKNKTQIKIEVRDNGMGIKSADLDLIMLPFQTTKKAGKTTGLGLSISFAIIKEMNGTIDIESEYSRWTNVKITLPRNSEV